MGAHGSALHATQVLASLLPPPILTSPGSEGKDSDNYVKPEGVRKAEFWLQKAEKMQKALSHFAFVELWSTDAQGQKNIFQEVTQMKTSPVRVRWVWAYLSSEQEAGTPCPAFPISGHSAPPRVWGLHAHSSLLHHLSLPQKWLYLFLAVI